VVDAPPPVAADAARPDAPSLSVREREVLRLLAQGLSNKELARALSVSENTVKTHLANLYAKLGVGRRTEALAIARRFGLDA
jgi:DNA-binding CsgD family transcriptional regulator